MPTTFNVFSLGVQAIIDPNEGNDVAENASALVGLTFGGAGNALAGQIQEFSPGSVGFNGGGSFAFNGGGSALREVYNQNNNPRSETFRINGGADQVFDAVASYNATITYIDGTTANITVIIFQDTAGNTYMAPHTVANTSQAALEALPIRSLTLNSVQVSAAIGLAGDRQFGNFLTCYVAGTHILMVNGEAPIETLAVGDLVMTKDHGAQPVRWIGKSTVTASGNMAPVRIMAGALGPHSPARDLLVSRQHRIMLSSKICQRMFGSDELLVPAIKLTTLPGVFVEETGAELTYYHLLTDAHQVIFAEGIASETMLTGPGALEALGPDYIAEIETIFPGVSTTIAVSARPIARGKQIDKLIARHQKNGLPLATQA